MTTSVALATKSDLVETMSDLVETMSDVVKTRSDVVFALYQKMSYLSNLSNRPNPTNQAHPV